jgi:hypothetical protein
VCCPSCEPSYRKLTAVSLETQLATPLRASYCGQGSIVSLRTRVRGARSPRLAQRMIIGFVQALILGAVEALIPDLQVRAEGFGRS